MLEKKDVRVGALVWWKAERHFKSWTCPAVITQVGKKTFRVKSLDDFNEIENLRMDDECGATPRREMRLASLVEVEAYLKKNEREKKDKVREEAAKLSGLRNDLKSYQQQVKKFLASQKKS